MPKIDNRTSHHKHKHLKLSIELVPSTSWYTNLRTQVGRETWDKIRKSTYKKYGNICGICGAKSRLNCHEMWEYDDNRHIQTLVGFIALCNLCHHVKHIGHAGIQASLQKLDFETVIEHFMRVNSCDRDTFEEHKDMAFDTWKLRSKHKWRIDLGSYDDLTIANLEKDDAQNLDEVDELMKIHGVGFATADKLRSHGIDSIDKLAKLDLVRQTIVIKNRFDLRRIQLNAKSFLSGEIMKIGNLDVPDKNSKIVYFDIETEPFGERIWMIGYRTRSKFYQLYANTWADEKKILARFLAFLKSLKEPIIISYSTTSFDFYKVYNALERLGLDYRFFGSLKHVDVGSSLLNSYILPINNYRLKEVGKYAGYPFKNDDLDGLAVAMEYANHITTGKKLERKYFEYNKDDVLAIPFIINYFRKYGSD